jgi:O-antigen/teichoic acid export membrane protein
MSLFQKLKIKYNDFLRDKHFGEIFSGSVLVFGAKIIATFIGLVTSVIVARYYGAEVVGVLALVNSFFAVVTVFTLMGTNTSILRLIPEYTVKYSYASAYKLYKKTRLVVILLSVILGIGLFFLSDWIAGFVFDRPDLGFLFMIASGVLVFKTLQNFSMQGIRAVQRIKAFALIQLITPIVYLILLIIFTFAYYNKYVPVYLQFINAIILALVSLWIITKTFKSKADSKEAIEIPSFKEILSISFPMFLTASIFVIMGQLATLMIGMFEAEEEVGYYATALKIATLTTFVLQAINTVVAPKFSELYHQGKIDDLFEVAKKSTKLIFWSALPLILIFVVFGKWIIIQLYGVEFEKSFPILLILSVGLFVNAIAGSVGYFMNMCGYEKTLRNVMFVSIIVAIVVNLILIPKIGVFGAAIATTITQVLWNITLTIFIKKKFSHSFLYLPGLNRIKKL